MKKKIGETFYEELLAAGVKYFGFSWCSDGSFLFNEEVSGAQKAKVMKVFEAHDPDKQPEPDAEV